MKATMNASPSFSGKLSVRTFTISGKIKSVEEYATTKIQDDFIKELSNTISPNGALGHRINRRAAKKFTTIIEIVTGKPLRFTRQRKLMTNGYDEYVAYGDKHPGKGGVLVKLDLLS